VGSRPEAALPTGGEISRVLVRPSHTQIWPGALSDTLGRRTGRCLEQLLRFLLGNRGENKEMGHIPLACGEFNLKEEAMKTRKEAEGFGASKYMRTECDSVRDYVQT
jgi:hypothetical protein